MSRDGLRNQHSEMAVRQNDATVWFCEMPKAVSSALLKSHSKQASESERVTSRKTNLVSCTES